MKGLPAHCSSCGLVFLAPNLIGGSASVHMSGNSTNCPRCGGRAAIGDGNYQLENSRVVGFAGPAFTKLMLDRLHSVAERAKQRVKQGTAEVEEILAEVADVSPELAQRLRSKHNLPIFVLILLLIWMLKSVELNVTVDFNHLLDQAHHIYQGEDPESHLDDPLPPPPERPKPASPSNVVDRLEGRPNRQARRRQQAQARTRPKGPARL